MFRAFCRATLVPRARVDERRLTRLLAARCESSGSSFAAAPDASRGFDVGAYDGLWRALSREPTWPSVQTVAVVGPAGDAFLDAAEATVGAAAGCAQLRITSKSVGQKRWQSVRIEVRCDSPDDFCDLHSRLSALDGTKAVV